MMQVITYRGRLVELTVLGDTINDVSVLECCDMSPDGGEWFTLSRDTDGVMILGRSTTSPSGPAGASRGYRRTELTEK
jgi:hypothetical protein